MKITIREASTQDFAVITSLSIRAYQEYSQALTPEHWHTMQTGLSGIAKHAQQAKPLVAELEGKLIGSVVYYAPGTSNSQIFQPEWASLRLLAVSPEHRGRGIGKLLSQKCINRAKTDKADVIGLHTSELMTKARRMYEKLGFRQDIELPRRLGVRYWRYILDLREI
jgi:ribosomal protein S18 acetylase RimI-like enzyme